MRLLNVHTREVKELTDGIPDYAILSHTWGRGEILLNDLQNGTARSKEAWGKVELSCRQAARDGLDFIWIDTCCIDKTSSTELFEAINSMFSWYQRAKVCYTYLSDVPGNDNIRAKKSKFASSKWFTRGWTLQELLAPREMRFFSNNWTELGEKKNLVDILAAITRIPQEALNQTARLAGASIAQRMSWASRRKTTRPEDMAYCLLGIFNVNMPLIYGEGGVRAFLRLQEEIMKISDDTSIFAWVSPNKLKSHLPHGLWATSIESFADSHNVILYCMNHRSPYSMTNKGLCIDFALLESGTKNVYFAPLDCIQYCQDNGDWRYLAIYLRQEDIRFESFSRVRVDSLPVPPNLQASLKNTSTKIRTIYVPQIL